MDIKEKNKISIKCLRYTANSAIVINKSTKENARLEMKLIIIIKFNVLNQRVS